MLAQGLGKGDEYPNTLLSHLEIRVYQISSSVSERDNFGSSFHIAGQPYVHLGWISAREHSYTIFSQQLWNSLK